MYVFYFSISKQTQQPKKVVFLSKAQREQMKKEEEAKKKQMLEVNLIKVNDILEKERTNDAKTK